MATGRRRGSNTIRVDAYSYLRRVPNRERRKRIFVPSYEREKTHFVRIKIEDETPPPKRSRRARVPAPETPPAFNLETGQGVRVLGDKVKADYKKLVRDMVAKEKEDDIQRLKLWVRYDDKEHRFTSDSFRRFMYGTGKEYRKARERLGSKIESISWALQKRDSDDRAKKDLETYDVEYFDDDDEDEND